MKKYETVFKNNTITLSLGKDGYWLYDETRRMNLAMAAKTETEAFVAAIMYYQRVFSETNKAYNDLRGQVDAFVSQFIEDEEEN